MREKFYLKTYGCKLNQADSDLIRGILSKDFQEVYSFQQADFIVINSCGVIEKTEKKIIKEIKKLRKEKKKIFLTGCLPLISSFNFLEIVDGIVYPSEILKIGERIKDFLLKKHTQKKFLERNALKIDKARYFSLKKRENLKDNCSAIVAIAEGCLGNCSYCATKFARGKLRSFEKKYIVEEIKTLVSLGFKEIQITSQDNACFGKDRGKFQLPELLKEILKIDYDFKIRIGMMNPQFVKPILRDLIYIFKSQKIYKYIHLPLQSGDNEILKKMKRGYTVEEFEEIVRQFNRNFKEILLATDIIVGFPTEGEQAFQNTLKFLKKIRPNIINITKFSPRENTAALKLPQLPPKVINERSKILENFSQQLRKNDNKKFLGRIFNVLVTKKSKNNTFLSRTDFYKAVILKEGKVGEKVKVKIVNFTPNYLIAQPLNGK